MSVVRVDGRPDREQRVIRHVGLGVALRAAAWVVLFMLAAGFLAGEVATYVAFSPESYGRFWPTRFWLAVHLAGGSMALLVGPFQFLRGLRTARPQLHRWTGRLYLAGIALAAAGAFRLAADRHPVFGFGFSAALFVMALVWIATTAMAFAAIRRRAIQVHREWMVRSYILTFSFVSFRIIGASSGVLGLMRVAPPVELVPVFVWASWALPLLVAELIFAGRRMPAHPH